MVTWKSESHYTHVLLFCELLKRFLNLRFPLTSSESCQVCENDSPWPIRLMADLCVYGLFTVYCTSCWSSKGKIWFIRGYSYNVLTYWSVMSGNFTLYWRFQRFSAFSAFFKEGITFSTELLNIRNLSFRWSSQASNINLAASQFAWYPVFSESPADGYIS